MRTIAIAAATCGAILLAGCGIKGPLFIPQPPKPVARPAPTPTPAQAPATSPAPGADHNKPATQDSLP